MQDKKVMKLSDSQFDMAIAKGVTQVDCWAPWCGTFKMQGPILEQVVKSIDGRAKIAKLNVYDARDVFGRFGVQAVTTLLLFKDGKEDSVLSVYSRKKF